MCISNSHFKLGKEDKIIYDLNKIGSQHHGTIKKIKNLRNKREAHNDLVDIFVFDRQYPTIDELICLYHEIAEVLSKISERMLGFSLSFGNFEELTTEYSLMLNNLMKTR